MKFGSVLINQVLTFTPDHFNYRDEEKSLGFNWGLFKPLEVYKDHLLLTYKENNAVLFILSRAELGDENYAELRSILIEKTGDLAMSMSDARKAATKSF